MFHVFENGIPCNATCTKVHESWNNNIFPTYEEALVYARKWIAPYGGSYDGLVGIGIPLNVPQDYSGMGTYIEIREI